MNTDFNLPKHIKVKVMQNKKSGVYLAELPDFDIFTEANSFSDLLFMVNDLIYTYFEIPENLRGKVWYSPQLKKKIEENLPMNPLLFTALTSIDDTKCNFA